MDLAAQLAEGLTAFSADQVHLPGINGQNYFNTLVAQLIESQRRIRYMAIIGERAISNRRTDPEDLMFDPLKAAVYYRQHGLTDEAFWMVFFFVHFGRHRLGGWRFAREVYGGQGLPNVWDWAATSADPEGFRDWLHANQGQIVNSDLAGGFGNHRKYQSLDARSATGTGAAFQSYVEWVNPPRTHMQLMDQKLEEAGGNAREAFSRLYHSMRAVTSFGRLARFDYLSAVSNLHLANIEPDSPHLQGSTGVLRGARLLFGPGISPRVMNARLTELGDFLGLGMQAIEDGLCNWQKSPQVFVFYRG